ncbi:unnamed protein product [Ectocarpus sp. 12 AP-2014]
MRVVIEENMLTLVYSSTGAGRPLSAANGHLKFSQDAVMLVHLSSSSSRNSPTDGFTVNEKVTTDDLYGNSTAASVTSQCSSILTDIQHPGKGVDWPTKALMFLVNRYSRQGDTVLLFGAEHNTGVETAISRGRKVEAFVASPEARAKVEARTEIAFKLAYAQGIFQSTAAVMSQVTISGGRLPCAIPRCNVPPGIQSAINEALDENEEMSDEDINLGVAQAAAAKMGWAIEKDDDDEWVLSISSTESYGPGERTLLVWGHMVVYDTKEEAAGSLCPDADAAGYVRLIRALDHEELQATCLPGKEFLGSQTSALYMRVDETCPMYYAKCAPDEDCRYPVVFSTCRPRDMSSYDQMAGVWKAGAHEIAQDSGNLGCPVRVQMFKTIQATRGSRRLHPVRVVTPASHVDFVVTSDWTEEEHPNADEIRAGDFPVVPETQASDGSDVEDTTDDVPPRDNNGSGHADGVPGAQGEKHSTKDDDVDKENAAAPAIASEKTARLAKSRRAANPTAGSFSVMQPHNTRGSSKKRGITRPQKSKRTGGGKKARRVLQTLRTAGQH